MNTRKMADDYIKRSKRYLHEAEDAHSDKDYATTVRRAQECVEMSLKAVLRCLSIEYPYRHDVGDIVEALLDKDLPNWFQTQIHKFAEISAELSKKRGPAMYGYEAELKPASELFDADDAKNALQSAKMVFELCEKFIEEYRDKNKAAESVKG